ncbi:MAG: hypothetical protein H6R26_1670 [Proteobacteria bacterium]|nr:hypothetical protein [Pseudomonadota bacterium]
MPSPGLCRVIPDLIRTQPNNAGQNEAEPGE